MHTVEKAPRIDVLVPHAITVCENPKLGTAALNKEGVPYAQAARAKSEYRNLRGLALAGQPTSTLFAITEHGGPEKLPLPEEDIARVVSKLTILAALRAGRPIDDLYFLYGDIRRTDGSFIGVKGLGQPQPQPRASGSSAAYQHNLGGHSSSPRRLINTCPYPGRIYAPTTAPFIAPDVQPLINLPIPQPHEQTKVMYNEELNEQATERLGVPVYRTWVSGIENDYAQADSGELRLANPNVLMALGAEAVEKGYVSFAYEVRHENTGTMLGGKALTMFSSGMLESPLI
ncbi:MAG TPA: hypothetical protein VLG16_04885 [Candidatus Saccharimonadales bacterium]|nr:hypothetical protein [Candidatus Saccharimonadales bacterium]